MLNSNNAVMRVLRFLCRPPQDSAKATLSSTLSTVTSLWQLCVSFGQIGFKFEHLMPELRTATTTPTGKFK